MTSTATGCPTRSISTPTLTNSVEGLFKSSVSAKDLERLLKNIIYIESGLESGLCCLVYGGKSKDGARRFIEHLAKQAEWLISGLEGAPKHYQEDGRCEKRVMFPYLRLSDELTEEEQGEGLAVHEAAVCWGLGSCTVKEDMLEVRASYGGPSFPGILGINSTQCATSPRAAPTVKASTSTASKIATTRCLHRAGQIFTVQSEGAEVAASRRRATRPLTPGA